jgi:hypothetical protein
MLAEISSQETGADNHIGQDYMDVFRDNICNDLMGEVA